MDDPKYQKAFNEVPDLRYILKSSMHIVEQLNNNVHPGDILHTFPAKHGIDKVPYNVYASIRIVDLFSQSVRSKSSDRYWVNPDSVAALFDPVVFKIYLGLIYEQVDNNMCFIDKSKAKADTLHFKSILNSVANNYDTSIDTVREYQHFILTLSNKLEETQKALRVASNSKDDNRTEAIFRFVQASSDLFDYTIRVKDLPYIKNSINKDVFMQMHKWLTIVDHTTDLYFNISDRQYSSAIINLTQIIDLTFTDEILIKSAKNKDDKSGKWKKDVLKYGTFMAAVVNAKSSDEVKAIIEATALPPGSYQVKRESKFNISLNSYLGFFAGREIIQSLPNNPYFNNYAVTAPVGISLTRGGIGKGKNLKSQGHALGAYLSLIDLGALASFRLHDDSSSVASKVELKNIVAPGIFCSYSIKGAPITLLVGTQVGPLLREVNAEDFKVEDNFYIRWGFSLVVDIPLFNLYNKVE